jgi:hypothetical protein
MNVPPPSLQVPSLKVPSMASASFEDCFHHVAPMPTLQIPSNNQVYTVHPTATLHAHPGVRSLGASLNQNHMMLQGAPSLMTPAHHQLPALNSVAPSVSVSVSGSASVSSISMDTNNDVDKNQHPFHLMMLQYKQQQPTDLPQIQIQSQTEGQNQTDTDGTQDSHSSVHALIDSDLDEEDAVSDLGSSDKDTDGPLSLSASDAQALNPIPGMECLEIIEWA